MAIPDHFKMISGSTDVQVEGAGGAPEPLNGLPKLEEALSSAQTANTSDC